jgi:hypothetical protein
VLSALALAVLGKLERGRPAAPINAVSHWLWGRQAFRHDAPRIRYTATGYLIHHAMSIFWGTLHQKAFARTDKPLCAATATAALACLVDYTVTPKRLRPGFEAKLSAASLGLVYLAFAAGLALTGPGR